MFDEDIDEEPAEQGKISLVMQGRYGKTFMIVDMWSDLPALKYAKELVDLEIAVDSNGELDQSQILPILKNWKDEKQRYIEWLGTDAYRLLDAYGLQFEAASFVLEKQLEIMHEEELDGRRMTFHVAGDRCWSVSKNSSLQELEAAKRIFEKDLDSWQVSKLEGFIANAQKERRVDDWMEEPIELKALSERYAGRHEISKDMHPDQLTVFLEKRWKELSNEEGDKIVSWIENSEFRNEDHDHRIRVFKNGLLSPEKSVEVDLSDHDIDYVEKLYIMRSSGAGMLPEHWRRLDRYYEELLAVSDENRALLRKAKGLEIPTRNPDKVVFVNQFMDRETLLTVAVNFRESLGKSGQAQLNEYIKNADEVRDPEETIRVYSFPYAEYKIISKEDVDGIARVWDEIGYPDGSLFASQKDCVLAYEWVTERIAPEPCVAIVESGEGSRSVSTLPAEVNTAPSETEAASPNTSGFATKQIDRQDLEKLERVFEDLYSTLGQLLNKNEPGRDHDFNDRRI